MQIPSCPAVCPAMNCFESQGQVCGEEVGQPDQRPFNTVGDMSFYAGNDKGGVRVLKSKTYEEDPDDRANVSVHLECWTLYREGTLAGRSSYPVEED